MALFGLFKSNNAANQNGPRTGIPVRSIIRYTHMPEILPRIRAIGAKLGHFAFMLALVYRSARLLPAGHPMLNPANIGRYGVVDVISTAANSLVIKRENIDQILIFSAVLLAFIMIGIQAVLICVYAFMNPAHAADGSMFTTPSPNTDLAFEFLRNVFGVPNMFGGATGTVSQNGFHAVMGMYSQAMMIVAVIIVVYYVITVVGEAAQSGTPFGRRFNGLWAPIRLILALGLLVPLGSNLNAAQYLTLNVAKLGSGLATNAWMTYTDKFLSGETVGMAATPSMKDLGGAVFSAEACRAAYNQANRGVNASKLVKILVQRGTSRNTTPATFTASDLSNMPSGAKQIKYIWTTQSPNQGAITEPTCGAIAMSVPQPSADPAMAEVNKMILATQTAFVEALGIIVKGVSKNITGNPDANSVAALFAQKTMVTNGTDWAEKSGNSNDATKIAQETAKAINDAQTAVNAAMAKIKFDNTKFGDGLSKRMKEDAKARGWMSAGIYYSEMSKTSQMLYEAMNNYPAPVGNPKGASMLEENKGFFESWFGSWTVSNATKEVRQTLTNLGAMTAQFDGYITVHPNNIAGKPPAANELIQTRFDVGFVENPMLWIGKLLFGDAFLILIDTPTLNPMNALLQAGNSILDRASWMIWVVAVAQGGAIISGIAGVLGAGPVGGAAMVVISQLLSALGGLIWFFLLLGMAAGVILFYLLPLLPMMYFFFSAVNWVIEVAEAFISMPLFALAHLRIDGDGLPGQVAYNGWLTLFGIMLRPILIIIGFIVGSLIFNAGAFYLIKIYKYAIFAYRSDTGTAGAIDFDKIGFFGLFVYIILFVYMIYLLANASFKLIDQIPDKAMRWIGGQQPFTGDRPVELGGMQGMALAGYGVFQQAKGAVGGFANIGKGLNEKQQEAVQGLYGKLRSKPGAAGAGAAGGAGGPPAGGAPPTTP